VTNSAIRWGVGTVIVVALSCGIVLGQSAQAPAFEVASVRRANPKASGQHGLTMRGGPGTPDPDQIAYSNITLMTMLINANDAFPFQIEGPAWLGSEQYDISAKVPSGATKDQFRLMLMNLIVERFHVVLHRESREVAGFELAVARNGSKLKVSAPADSGDAAPSPSGPPAPPKTDADGFPRLDHPGVAMAMKMDPQTKGPSIYLTFRAQTLAGLVHTIGEELGRPVVDKTGLAGTYDFKLKFAPASGTQAPPSAPGLPDVPDESGPGILAAMQEQLGLKLEPKKVPLDMLIIDSVDKVPTEN
jgi:uncharacterized protein (TIGR03435 family)